MFLKTVACRGFQAVLKIANYVLPYRTPQVLEGPGQIRNVGQMVKDLHLNRVLVVTGDGMMRRGGADGLLQGLEQAGICYTVLTFDHPDPTSDDVEKGVCAYHDNGCQAIVALGGGSRIDCAKAIAARISRPKRTVRQLQGLLKVRKNRVPLIAVPTTAGAGSETTVAAVITDHQTHRKAAINDPALIPQYAVLDPELTVSLPSRITAETGMDALTHAVEAYLNHTYNTKLENQMAEQAVRLIYDNLATAVFHGEDLQARQNMQRAAFYAGRAFTRGCVGYVHAVGHTLGGLYGIPHGQAMAALLPKVLRMYGKAAHGRLAKLAELCGMTGKNDAELAEAFIRWVEECNRRFGIPEGFREIRPEHIEQMVQWADKESNPLYPVPVVWEKKDFRRLIAQLNSK